MTRRTKIVATLGPASSSPEMIEKLINAGANVFRLNFSHGQPEDHINRAKIVREMAAKNGKHVAILGDLQGPKIRIARFKNTKVNLNDGDTFVLDVGFDKNNGDETRVGIDYPQLATDSEPGNILLLDDGRVVLEVLEVKGQEVITKVIVGGPLSNNKGINRQGGGLSAAALTDKDKEDIKTAAALKADYLAVSFPRSAEDIEEARSLAKAAGLETGIVSKVERAEAVADNETLDAIILASDAVMVARGDLGVEIGDAELIGVQKHMIKRCRQLNRPVITATQMMETMITSAMPTRAEVFDVANAVLDGTDAVMLSAETAAGDYPEEVIQTMVRVCKGAEKQPAINRSKHRLDVTFTSIDETIAMSAMYAANHLEGVSAIISLTESGTTPLLMSRISSGLPIYALSPNQEALNRVALYRGVTPIAFPSKEYNRDNLNQGLVDALKAQGLVKDGDLVILTKGDHLVSFGTTNAMKIVRIGDVH
ncbi:MAG: pyruvate kinase [Marinomonas sp.]|jgi:pyruvate kinase|uniref:pyruvate kinase n=1 Tax=unclassified Marinomonas TaxID=196814 RepID=UPI0005FA210C|nr:MULTISPECIES: pyruvate kinase [unclassified Marinomonas]KJZ13200.1 pyruvate kinase [Marinomonas sp. S3726]KZM45831.1 pyruvate kinase [Marinomonas sp. SBI22]KZM46349.1 pyruvate kinase [Marinomonas sp. SBI8L]